MASMARAHPSDQHLSEQHLHLLLKQVRACRLCEAQLPLAPKPVLQAGVAARILIVGQAPGRKAHESGLPFNDPSGDRLRRWLGVDREAFYDPDKFALVPMGFCYPGTGSGGDLPPLPQCAATWRERILKALPHVELTLVMGQYALAWHLPQRRSASVSALVSTWQDHWPRLLPMPHPSPRNQRWLAQHPWFEQEVIPHLRARVQSLLD